MRIGKGGAFTSWLPFALNSLAPDTVHLYWAGGPHTNGNTRMSRGIEWTCYPMALITYYKHNYTTMYTFTQYPIQRIKYDLNIWDMSPKTALNRRFIFHCDNVHDEIKLMWLIWIKNIQWGCKQRGLNAFSIWKGKFRIIRL